MNEINKDTIIQIIRSVNPPDKSLFSNQSKQGREQDFKEVNFLRVFILMMLINIPTIKGIWKYLNLNQDIAETCGFSRLPDRSTFSRRLNKLDIQKWI